MLEIQYVALPSGPLPILNKWSCSNRPGHMTKMAAMPIYGKNLKKSSSPEPIDQWPWNLVCSIVYGSTTKVKVGREIPVVGIPSGNYR